MTDRETAEAALSEEFETESGAPQQAPRWIQQQQRQDTELDRIRAEQAMQQQLQL